MILAHRPLSGPVVQLEPLGEGHRDGTRQVLESDAEVWPLLPTCGVGEHFEAYWRAMTDMPGRLAYAVRSQVSGAIVGVSSFLDVEPAHRSVQIGGTFFAPACRGMAANPASKLLMLREAFDAGALRVHFAIDALNAPSQAAVLKLGATREGLLRRHRITWTGRERDTVVFSILADEWPQVRERLEQRLSAERDPR